MQDVYKQQVRFGDIKMYKIPLQNISNLNNKIQLFCRESDGSLKIITDDSFMSYYYEKTTDEKADAISIYGESLRKIYCQKPGDIRKQRSVDSYEADIVYTKRYILDKVEEFVKSKPRILFLDIEVGAKELPHPKEDQKLDDPITIIRIYDNYTKKWKKWRLDKWKSEYEMLENFCATIKKLSPDIITIWNKDFDYYALYYRIGEEFPAKISPINQIHWRNGFAMPAGISIIDEMGLYAKHTLHKKDSYALMNVAHEELNYEIEEDFDFTDINTSDKKNKEDVEKMVKLDEKLHLFDYFDETRLISRCLWEDLPSEMKNYQWQSNNSKVIDMLALAEAKRLNVILPSKQQDTKREKMEGAYRITYGTGLYKDLAKVDISGAYPEAIIDFCLSPENFSNEPSENTIKIDILSRETNEHRATYYVKQNPNAILPSLVKRLLTIKNELKAKLKSAKKETEEYKKLLVAYDSRKALVNTSFGCIAMPIFRLYDNRNGDTITFLIRDLLHFVENKFQKQNKQIQYIDTDSVPNDTPVLIKKNKIVNLIPIEDLFLAPKTISKSKLDYSNKDVEIWTDKGWTKIKYIYRHKTDKLMYRILSRTAFIECSEDHSLVVNGKSISPNQLQVGDNLETIPFLLQENNNVNPDLAWLLGFFLAEGSTGVYKYKNKKSIKYSWAINQQKKKPLYKCKKILNNLGIDTKSIDTLKEEYHVIYK